MKIDYFEKIGKFVVLVSKNLFFLSSEYRLPCRSKDILDVNVKSIAPPTF